MVFVRWRYRRARGERAVGEADAAVSEQESAEARMNRRGFLSFLAAAPVAAPAVAKAAIEEAIGPRIILRSPDFEWGPDWTPLRVRGVNVLRTGSIGVNTAELNIDTSAVRAEIEDLKMMISGPQEYLPAGTVLLENETGTFPPLVPQTWDGLDLSKLSDRKGDWMQTSQGRQFWPLDPRVEDIHIEDIAAGLSRLCRYGGQLRDDVEFYSVAEHSVHIAEAAPPGLKLTALLHDSPESFIQDLIRPIKPFVRDYEPIETGLALVIGKRFGVTLHPLPDEIKRLDNAILADERDQVMAKPPKDWQLKEPALGIKLQCWSPFKARQEFLAAFRRYGGHWSI